VIELYKVCPEELQEVICRYVGADGVLADRQDEAKVKLKQIEELRSAARERVEELEDEDVHTDQRGRMRIIRLQGELQALHDHYQATGQSRLDANDARKAADDRFCLAVEKGLREVSLRRFGVWHLRDQPDKLYDGLAMAGAQIGYAPGKALVEELRRGKGREEDSKKI